MTLHARSKLEIEDDREPYGFISFFFFQSPASVKRRQYSPTMMTARTWHVIFIYYTVIILIIIVICENVTARGLPTTLRVTTPEGRGAAVAVTRMRTRIREAAAACIQLCASFRHSPRVHSPPHIFPLRAAAVTENRVRDVRIKLLLQRRFIFIFYLI